MRVVTLLVLGGCVATSGTSKTDSGTADDTAATAPGQTTDTRVGTTTTTTTTSTTTTSTSTSTPTPDHTAVPVDDSVQQHCVDTINAYRATLGLTPYARWTSGEACADGEAESDAYSGVPHGAFGSCGEWAQNECPGWSGDLTQLTTDCLAMMWAEGPGADFSRHGHYINMSSTQYSEVACGYFTLPNGDVWAVQNFR
jgi:hypothetical protein